MREHYLVVNHETGELHLMHSKEGAGEIAEVEINSGTDSENVSIYECNRMHFKTIRRVCVEVGTITPD